MDSSRSAAWRSLAPYHVWLKLALCLALLAWWVDAWFVPHWLAPHYLTPQPMVRDRTLGKNVAVLFALLPQRTAPDDVIVVLVGDSSVGGAAFDQFTLAWMLERDLRARLPGRRVQVVDFSLIGLGARDAQLFVAKGFGLDPDLVVYAVSPRVAPSEPEWVTSVRDLAFEWDIVSRLGVRPVLEVVGVEQLGRSLVYSSYPPARLRTELGRAAAEALTPHLPPLAAAQLERIAPPPLPKLLGRATREITTMKQRRHGTSGWMWQRTDYRVTPPTSSTRALDRIVDLCGREGRCLLYEIPVNPEGARTFEPGLLDEFVTAMAARATTAGVPFRDWRGFCAPTDFIRDEAGLPDAIHPNAAGLDGFAPVLADAVVARMTQLGPR